MKRILQLLILSTLCACSTEKVTKNSTLITSGETEATKLLKEQNQNLKREIVQLSDRVYAAVGYDVSNITMVVGDDGLIIIDTGMIPRLIKELWEDLRKISDKPLKAIVFTHGHGDHTRGAPVFLAGTKNVQIWARENYGEETRIAQKGGLRNNLRPIAQGGFMLQPEQRINNGVAIAVYPTPDGNPAKPRKPGAQGPQRTVFDRGVEPTHTFAGDKQVLNIAGVTLELHAAPGETADQLFVWLPEDKVLCTGDNFYRSWPNLYAIRGTAYRDVFTWINSLSKMLEKDAEAIVPGHTRVVMGKEESKATLTNYRDAVKHVFEQTMEGIAQGMGPDQLVEYVKLPDHLKDLDYLREYYGRIDYSVRSIHNGYLGWFDGNATSLIPLAPKEEAERMVKLAGGKTALLTEARAALKNRDFQWAAQLADYLISLDANDKVSKLLKADALAGLAMHTHNAITRNYYLTTALRLRAKAKVGD